MNLTLYKIDYAETLLSAAKVISLNKSRCAVVTSKDKAIGVFSEGDLLRALLKGADIHSKLKPYVNHGLVFLEERSLKKALPIFKRMEITLLPVLSKDLTLIDVILLGEILELASEEHIEK